jgi:hypothetical protein
MVTTMSTRSLALRRHPRDEHYATRRVDPYRRALEGSKGRAFDVAGEADAGKPPLGARARPQAA